MNKSFLIALASLVILGCASSPNPAKTPTGQTQEAAEIAQADRLLAAQDYENAALLYRSLLDRFEKSGEQEFTLRKIEQNCTRAMVEAGGFASSYTLWQEMASKKPESKPQATRMQSRAKRMILQQARELLQQAETDLQQGHRRKALATARASEQLLTLVEAEEVDRRPVEAFLENLEKSKAD